MLKSLRTGDMAGRALVGTLLMAGCLALGGVTCDQDRAVAVERLNEGLEAYRQNDSFEAVEKLKKAVEADADYAKPRYLLGQIYEMSLDDFENAERYYRAALEIKPKNPKYAYGLGRALASSGKYKEAIEYFRLAIAQDEHHAAALFRLGASQEAMGENREAVESYMKSIEADPRMRLGDNDPGGAAYHALGDLYVRYEYYDKALKVYENGTKNNPESARLYRGRGVAQLEMKRYGAAARSFEKSLELDDDQASAYFNLGIAHEAMGHKKQAVHALKRYTRTASRDSPARLQVARGKIQTLEAEMENDTDGQ